MQGWTSAAYFQFSRISSLFRSEAYKNGSLYSSKNRIGMALKAQSRPGFSRNNYFQNTGRPKLHL